MTNMESPRAAETNETEPAERRPALKRWALISIIVGAAVLACVVAVLVVLRVTAFQPTEDDYRTAFVAWYDALAGPNAPIDRPTPAGTPLAPELVSWFNDYVEIADKECMYLGRGNEAARFQSELSVAISVDSFGFAYATAVESEIKTMNVAVQHICPQYKETANSVQTYLLFLASMRG